MLKSFSFEMPIGTVHHPPIDVKIPAQSTGIKYLDAECIHTYIFICLCFVYGRDNLIGEFAFESYEVSGSLVPNQWGTASLSNVNKYAEL